ncbi:hypothetical protein [Kribbella sp. NBC_00359]|uniref:hypothetical protein n=1 Tax=Kribbella sp. NBC_00359 TaxID=2975966 RepID=UPI002E1D34B2
MLEFAEHQSHRRPRLNLLIPLPVRYDPPEKLHGEPFPHLFVRRIAAPNEVLSPSEAGRLRVAVAASAGAVMDVA